MIGKDDRLVGCEDGVELVVGEAVGMFGGRLDGHQIDDINDADFDIGEGAAEQIDGGKSF